MKYDFLEHIYDLLMKQEPFKKKLDIKKNKIEELLIDLALILEENNIVHIEKIYAKYKKSISS